MEKKKRRVRKPDWFKVTYDSEVGVVGQMMEDDSLQFARRQIAQIGESVTKKEPLPL